MNMVSCIRIDHQDGSESVVGIRDAYLAIEDSYAPAEPAKQALREGLPVRCLFATYRLRAAAGGLQPTGGQPSPAIVEDAMREDGFLPPPAMREAETPDPDLFVGEDGYSTCIDPRSDRDPPSELPYELLLRTGSGWTPAGRFRTRRMATLAAMAAGCGDRFLIDAPRRKKPPVGRA